VIERLPSTIIHPQAFMRSPPAAFDGAFHWQYINDVLRPYRGIQCADVDAMVEMSGVFLSFETKDEGVDIPWGQEQRTRAFIDSGLVAHFDIWGKEKPTRWALRSWWNQRGDFHEDGDCRNAIADRVAAWAKWADSFRYNPAHRDLVGLRAAWRRACAEAREQFAKDVLNPSFGNFESTPLAQAALARARILR
jgi:hypothetical protein